MRIVVSSFVIAAWSLCLVESVFLVPGGRGYRIPLTDSVPFGLYKVTDEPVSRGLFVAECLPLDMATFATERGYLQEGSCPGKVMPLLKEVVAVEGDEVDLTWAYVAVNGHVIFSSETRIIDSKGRAVPAFRRGKFRLKPGEFLSLGLNSERSWDGRYMGPTKVADVIATLKPVWRGAGNEQ